MGSEQRLGVTIKSALDKKGFEDTRDEAAKTERAVSASAEKMSAGYKESLEKIRNASVIAFAALSAGAGLAAREAGTQEDALNRARAAVEISGGSWDTWSEKVQSSSAKLQAITRFADDEFAAAFADITLLTGSAQKGFEGMGLAADLAAGLHMNLESATRYVAIAMSGEVGMLSRYVPALRQMDEELGKNATQSEKAAYITNILRQQFGGLAEREAKTLTGSISQTKNAVGDAAEEIGNALSPSIKAVSEKVKEITISIGGWSREHQGLTRAITATTLAITGLTAASAATALMIPKISAAINVSVASFVLARNALIPFATSVLAAQGFFQSATYAWTSGAMAVGLVAGQVLAASLAIGAISKAVRMCSSDTEDWSFKLRDAKDNVDQLADASRAAVPDIDALSAVFGGLGVVYEEYTNLAGETVRITYEQKRMFDDLVRLGMSVEGAWYAATHVQPTPEQIAAFDSLKPKVKEASEELIKFRASVAALASSENLFASVDFSQVKPREPDETEQFQGPEYDPFAVAQSWIDAEKKRADAVERIRQQEAAAWDTRNAALIAAYQTGIDSIVDTDMTGKERREAIWNSFKLAAVRQVGETVLAYVKGEALKKAAAITSAAAGAAASSAATATEKGNILTLIVGWLKVAMAKLSAFYAFSGPFAPALALGTLGGIVAAMSAIGSRVAGFQQGGIVPGYGIGDRVPAMLEPGERVVSRREYSANPAGIENAIAGRGGVTVGQVVVNAERGISIADMLNIRRMFEDMLPDALDRALNERRLSPAFSR